MVTTKELTNVPGLDPGDKVVIRKLGYGSLAKLRGKAAKSEINPVTKTTSMNIELGSYSKWLLVYGVIEAPFFKNCRDEFDKERVIDNDDIEAETGEFLFKELEALNNFSGMSEAKKN